MRFVIVLVILGLVGCATGSSNEAASALTPGMTKKYIYPGKTTQTEILEVFGPPDLVTRKEGKEVWTYDKISQELSSSGGYLTILIAGYGRQRQQSSNRSVMLIIYFNEKEVVQDYKLSSAKF